MNKRKIEECSYSSVPITVDAGFIAKPKEWLSDWAKKHALTTLLAHADDGVIWGRMDGGQLSLSGKAFPDVSPSLRAITLRQVRLFGPNVELLVWRDGDGAWHGRLLDDRGMDAQGWCFDESQLQWGDHPEDERSGFTLVADGQEGLRHAAPMPKDEIPFGTPGWRPLRLKVRHYLERDKRDGMLIVIQSRLVELWTKELKEGSNE